MKTNSSGFVLLRSIVLVLSILVLVIAAIMGIASGRGQARDARRVADIKQVSEALKVYYENNQKYPEDMSSQPKDMANYLEFWPKSPTPSDGSCTKEVNNYFYQQLDNGESYVLGFCIGHAVGGFDSGYYRINP